MAWGGQAICLHQNCKPKAHFGCTAFSLQGKANLQFSERAGRGELTKTGVWVREIKGMWDACCTECPCIPQAVQLYNSFACAATGFFIR